MNIKTTRRLKLAIFLALILSSLLAVLVYTDAFGVRTYDPAITNNSNGEVFVSPVQNSASNKISISSLFNAKKPAIIKTNDLKFLESDFLGKLNDVPLRDSNPVGIENKGNSCYADSVIQMLFRIPSVRKIVANLDIYHARAELLNSQPKYPAEALKNIFAGLSVIEGLNHMFYQLEFNETKPATFKFEKSMQCMPGQFARNGQEDADEYFNFIMTNLKEIIPTSQYHHLLLTVSLNGILTSKSDPTRKDQKYQNDVETRISLPFNGPVNVSNLLDAYFAPETVDLKFDDGTPGSLVRSKRLENLPETVIIHVQRLSADYNAPPAPSVIKKEDAVEFPNGFSFDRYIGKNCTSKPAGYRLKMFIVHEGGATDGHYYAYVHDVNGDTDTWYTLNDSGVTTNVDSSVAQNARQFGYLYFYEKETK